VLEAIYLLASARSFRADREKEMIYWGASFARLEAAITRNSSKHRIIAKLEEASRGITKRYEVDTNPAKTRQLPATMPASLFSADDIRLVAGAPGRRRKATDLVIGQVFPAYREALSRYSRALASRNRLLEQINTGEAGHDQLDVWDEQVGASGSEIIAARQRYVKELNNKLGATYQDLTATSPANASAKIEPLKIAYEPATTDLATELVRRRTTDLSVGTTTTGPHRDDWSLVLNGRRLASFGSSGEFRSAMLALRLTEAGWIEHHLGIRPLMLLDDVFSELDEYRRDALLEHLGDSQVVITTPEAEILPTPFKERATLIELGGAIDVQAAR
jgi:DNA replication and repair protein RecF